MAILIKNDGTKQSGLVDDDVIQPFSLERSNVRGRMVRLGRVLTEIIDRHKYPPPVAALLSELITMGLLLSGMMKYDGLFTLQIKGDGPVRMLVADVTNDGKIRAYAGFDEAAVKKAAKRKKDLQNHYYHLLGKKGYLAFTIDQPKSEDRYQGIVELKGESIADAVQHYFTQSEQIKTSFKLAVHPQDSQSRSAAIMIQQIAGDELAHFEENEMEDWTRAAMLLDTCTESEMLSPVLHSADVLFRLFHEDGVRVYSPTHVRFGCRCSRKRVSDVLRTIPHQELEEICKEEGKVSITCEFCSKTYDFNQSQIHKLHKK